MRRRRFFLVFAPLTALVLLLALNGLTGTLLLARAQPDPLVRADAIVVLGGEHDGREAYGLQLAEQGYGKTVLMSNPYPSTDKVMKKACRPHAGVEVICHKPDLLTTRGEAIMARQFAEKYGWSSIIVVSWRFHLPRARRIFDQCFSAPGRTVAMRDVPRAYSYTVAQWQYVYLYQYGGWLKAEIQGRCA